MKRITIYSILFISILFLQSACGPTKISENAVSLCAIKKAYFSQRSAVINFQFTKDEKINNHPLVKEIIEVNQNLIKNCICVKFGGPGSPPPPTTIQKCCDPTNKDCDGNPCQAVPKMVFDELVSPIEIEDMVIYNSERKQIGTIDKEKVRKVKSQFVYPISYENIEIVEKLTNFTISISEKDSNKKYLVNYIIQE